MQQFIHILIIVTLSAAVGSCTSARWTVKEKSATDKNDYELVDQKYTLHSTGELSPQNPVFELNVYSLKTYEYTQRVLMERNIQEYKLRPGFLALGMGGAALSFYIANSGTLGNSNNGKSITFNSIGVLLAASGFLNMKPVGEPRPTGEERLLRNSGTTIQTDTVKNTKQIDASASIAISYEDSIIFEEDNREISGGKLRINLAGMLNDLQFSGADLGSIGIEVNFQDSVYTYEYPVEEVLQPYARVTSQLTELRNSPEESPDNVLADLIKGSQIQIQADENEEWYRVLYGISENFVKKEDVELIWRSTDFIDDDQVVTVPRVPFGDVDVESNIPVLRNKTSNAVALIVTNENYSGDLPQRNYAHRDGRLIKTYLSTALGYQEDNIFELEDIDNPDELFAILDKMGSVSNDSTELFVYLSGYGNVETDNREARLEFLGVNDESGETSMMALQRIFEQIAQIPSNKTLVLGDVDFSHDISSNQFSANEARNLIELSAAPLSDKQQTSLLFGTRLGYPSNLYVAPEEDKKHHIFPYYFSKAVQERRTRISDIYQYLERNISYTARKLYDRPQAPLLIGSTSLDLISR